MFIIYIMSCAIYIVNYKDDERKRKMINRVKTVGLDAHFVAPVSTSDPRIGEQPITDFEKRNWSIFSNTSIACAISMKIQPMIIVLYVKTT